MEDPVERICIRNWLWLGIWLYLSSAFWLPIRIQSQLGHDSSPPVLPLLAPAYAGAPLATTQEGKPTAGCLVKCPPGTVPLVDTIWGGLSFLAPLRT